MANTSENFLYTEDTRFFFGEEQQNGGRPLEWTEIDPSDVPTFSPSVTNTPRNTLGGQRDMEAGAVTDFESNVSMNLDITISNVVNWMSGFQFCAPYAGDSMNVSVTNITATDIVIPAANDPRVHFPQDCLVAIKGSDENDGIHIVGAGNTATAIKASGLTAETLTGKDVTVSLIGMRMNGGTGQSQISGGYDNATKLLTITKNNVFQNFDPDSNGNGGFIREGTLVCIGRPNNDGSGGFTHALSSNTKYGYGFVKSIDASNLVIEVPGPRLSGEASGVSAVAAGDLTGIGQNTYLEILFGEFIPNRNRHEDNYKRTCYQFGQQLASFGTFGVNVFNFLNGNVANTFSLDWSTASLATMALGFTGTDADMSLELGAEQGSKGRINGGNISSQGSAASATLVGDLHSERYAAPLNTTNSFARLQIKDADDNGVETIFESISLALDNNASRKLGINRLGAVAIPVGQYNFTMSGSAYYMDPKIQKLIVANTTVGADFIAKNEEGVFSLRIPRMKLGDGSLTYPNQDLVMVQLNGSAFRDKSLDYSMAVNVIHYPIEMENEEDQ